MLGYAMHVLPSQMCISVSDPCAPLGRSAVLLPLATCNTVWHSLHALPKYLMKP